MGGRPRSNIGMTWQKFSTDPEFGGGDKYDTILQDSVYKGQKKTDKEAEIKKQKNEANNAVLKDIIKLNGPISWLGDNDNAVCSCGKTTLMSNDRIRINYHSRSSIKEMKVKGKKCTICGKTILFQNSVIEEFHKLEK